MSCARRRALLVPLVVALGACVWARDRAADLADVLVVEGSLGYGLSADVKLTELLHVGAGYAHGRKAGLRGREALWLRDREVGLPASLLPWVGALRDGEAWRLLHLHLNASELWHGTSPWRLADVEVGVFAGVVGVRLGLSPGELLDLLAGLVGLDPAGDDEGPRFEPAPGEPLEEGVWLVGDLHDHCDPPDGGHAPVTPAETHALAEAAGLDFVGINPHLWLEGAPMEERADLHELARQVRALEDAGGPIVIPGLEVMVRGARGARGPAGSSRGRGGPGRGARPLGPSGHVLLLFRDPQDAFAFDRGLPDERAWVEDRLALPPDRRLWVPAHPWPHERVRIPIFTDHAGDWKQLEELPAGDVTLGDATYARWATPWQERPLDRDGPVIGWRLARYRLDAAARQALPPLPDASLTTDPLPLDAAPQAARLVATAPAAWRAAPAEEAGAGTAQAAAALALALGRELADAPPGALVLEVAGDLARNAWLWARLSREPGRPDELTVTWAAGPRTPLHDVPVDGLEVLSGLVHLASLAVGRRGDELDAPQVLARLEARMLAERRRVVPLGGSDNHRDLVWPTLWVFARERGRAAIFEALRQGRVVVGGPQAVSLRARTDLDPVWRAVGAAPRAARWVELRWDGEAELFVDGRSLGPRRGGFRHEVRPGEPHLYRIVRGPSSSGWIHVNLPD